jgi:hypothetical protein
LSVNLECGLSDRAPSVALICVAKAVRSIHENTEKDGLVCLAKPGFDDEAAKLDFLACVFLAV